MNKLKLIGVIIVLLGIGVWIWTMFIYGFVALLIGLLFAGAVVIIAGLINVIFNEWLPALNHWLHDR